MIDSGFICPERRGATYRRVVEVKPTRAVIWYLMQKLEPGKSPVKDVRMLEHKETRIFLVDDVGVIVKGYLLNSSSWPDVHVGFWDKVLVGREEMCYIVGSMIAQDACVKGLWTAIPKAARPIMAFAKRVGFVPFVETPEIVGLEISFHGATRGI